MTSPVAASVFAAARNYGVRMAGGHASAYPLAALGGFAAEQLDRAGTHAPPSYTPFGAWLLGAFAALGVFAMTNVLAHRWATSAASLRATENSEWVDHVVTMLLQRASGEDRRGVRAVRRVLELLGSDRAASRAARFALDRVGGQAVGRIAEALASVPQGDQPIGQRVQARVVHDLARQRASRRVALVAWSSVIVAAALFARLAVRP